MIPSPGVPQNASSKVPKELLRKYDRPGPRYTSYPTVPVWSEEFGPSQYADHLKRYAATERPISVYVHLPFCEARCTFCGCNVVIASRQETVERYLDYLFREIDNVSKRLGPKRRLLQLHWGGGTPTFLSIEQMSRLWHKLHDHFDFDPDAEIGIEVDPRVTTEAQMRHLRSLGFNRLSMGVQDLTPDVQEAMGRGQTVEETERLYELGRELGFTGINMDLIFGLPKQSVEQFTCTIDRIAAWRPDRLAVYSYAHVPWLKPNQMQINESDLPTGPDKFALFECAITGLVDAGYVTIGFDHFALPTDELALGLLDGRLHRNFMGYTVSSSRDMIGLGVSAIGDIADGFAQNDSRLGGYYRRIDEDQFGTYRGWTLSMDDRIRRQVILDLMCSMRLSYKSLEEDFAINAREYLADSVSHLGEFLDDGLLEEDIDGIRINESGRHFIRNIAMVFDVYLPRLTEEQAIPKPMFSQTV